MHTVSPIEHNLNNVSQICEKDVRQTYHREQDEIILNTCRSHNEKASVQAQANGEGCDGREHSCHNDGLTASWVVVQSHDGERLYCHLTHLTKGSFENKGALTSSLPMFGRVHCPYSRRRPGGMVGADRLPRLSGEIAGQRGNDAWRPTKPQLEIHVSCRLGGAYRAWSWATIRTRCGGVHPPCTSSREARLSISCLVVTRLWRSMLVLLRHIVKPRSPSTPDVNNFDGRRRPLHACHQRRCCH